MTDSIEDLLKKRNYSEPEEISIARDYIFKKYGKIPGFKLSGDKLIINVPSAALAGALQPDLHKLQAKLKTKKQLVIHIARP